MFGFCGRSYNMFFGISFTLRSCIFAGVSYTLGSFVSDTLFREGIMLELPSISDVLSNELLTSSPDYSACVVVEGWFSMTKAM